MKYITLILSFIVAFSEVVSSQTISDNFGTTFYLAFPPNSNEPRVDYLALYLTSRDSANATISIAKLNYTKNVTVPPNVITPVFLPYIEPYSAEIRKVEQVVAGGAIKVTSDKQIAVYGHSHLQASTDAYLGLPVDVLGKEYYILSYQTLADTFPSSFGVPFYVTRPGQIVIVGTEDNTSITITPSCSSITGKPQGVSFQVLLNSTDVYLLQSDTTKGQDLTGTHIQSDKPIGIISGHNNTSIPDTGSTLNNKHATTDILLEQLPSVSSWGNSAVVIPFATSQAPDVVRIISAEDGNEISINGAAIATLDKGELYEIPALIESSVIKSTNPMLVGQYMHSTILTGGVAYGDPAFSLVYPAEQYDTAYTVMSIQDPAYSDNFINLSLPSSGIGNISLDGVLIPVSSFQTIGTTGYSYAQLNVSQGVHRLQGSIPFGCTIYAMGSYDSYAYEGGTQVKALVPAVASFVNFDTVLACGSYSRKLRLTNPNSVDAKLTSVTVDEVSSSGFSIDATLPLVIPPGGERVITVRFTPTDTGYFSGTVSLVFGSPRRDTIQIPLSAYAYKETLVYRAPSELHILGNESILVPLYLESSINALGIQEYDLLLRYNPELIEDVDYVLDNTYSSNGYYEVLGEPGARLIHFTSFANYSLTGGKPNDSIPLIKIKFIGKKGLDIPNSIQTLIKPEIILRQAAIEDGCLTKTFSGGKVVLDTVCSSPHLVKGVAPNEPYLSLPYPNPASSMLTVEVSVPKYLQQMPINVEIHDNIGRKVKSILSTSASTKHEISTDGLSNGLHMITLNAGEIRKSRYIIISR